MHACVYVMRAPCVSTARLRFYSLSGWGRHVVALRLAVHLRGRTNTSCHHLGTWNVGLHELHGCVSVTRLASSLHVCTSTHHFVRCARASSQAQPDFCRLPAYRHSIFAADPLGWESYIQHVLDADGLAEPEDSATSAVEVFCTNKARLRCQLVQKDDGHERV